MCTLQPLTTMPSFQSFLDVDVGVRDSGCSAGRSSRSPLTSVWAQQPTRSSVWKRVSHFLKFSWYWVAPLFDLSAS